MIREQQFFFELIQYCGIVMAIYPITIFTQLLTLSVC